MSSQLHVPAASPAQPAGPGSGPEPPKEYGVTRLVLMPRDPGWLHAYWEVADYTWAEVERLFCHGPLAAGKPVLLFRSGGNGVAFEVEVNLDARTWYVRMPGAGQWKAELGLKLPDGRFALLAASNDIRMPAGRVSEMMDAKWAVLKSEWERLFELSGAGRVAGGSLDMARAMALHWEFMSNLSSWPGRLGGASWPSSPRRLVPIRQDHRGESVMKREGDIIVAWAVFQRWFLISTAAGLMAGWTTGPLKRPKDNPSSAPPGHLVPRGEENISSSFPSVPEKGRGR